MKAFQAHKMSLNTRSCGEPQMSTTKNKHGISQQTEESFCSGTEEFLQVFDSAVMDFTYKVPAMSHQHSRNIPEILQLCYCNILPIFLQCFRNVPAKFKQSYSSIPGQFQQCSGNVVGMFHHCSRDTPVSVIFQCDGNHSSNI